MIIALCLKFNSLPNDFTETTWLRAKEMFLSQPSLIVVEN